MQLQVIQNKIYEIRGEKVMPDFDLAELDNAETKYAGVLKAIDDLRERIDGHDAPNL